MSMAEYYGCYPCHRVVNSYTQLIQMNLELHPSHMCFDSVNDNYATHVFLAANDVISIIDINYDRKKDSFHSFDSLNVHHDEYDRKHCFKIRQLVLPLLFV